MRDIWKVFEPFTQGYYVNTEPSAAESRLKVHTYNYAPGAGEKPPRPKSVPAECEHPTDGARVTYKRPREVLPVSSPAAPR
jgi:hypothetical protein